MEEKPKTHNSTENEDKESTDHKSEEITPSKRCLEKTRIMKRYIESKFDKKSTRKILNNRKNLGCNGKIQRQY